MFYEFPTSAEAYKTESQHMVGSALLVAPVTKPGVSSWDVHLPPSAVWYDFSSGAKAQKTGDFSIDVNLHTVPVWQKGGTIVPTLQRVRRSSAVMMNDPYTLTVAPDAAGTATGSLYIDDGKSYDYRDGKFVYVKFTYGDGKLTASADVTYETAAWLEAVKVLGVDKAPSAVTLGDGTSLGFKYDPEAKVLTVRKPGVSLGLKTWAVLIKA